MRVGRQTSPADRPQAIVPGHSPQRRGCQGATAYREAGEGAGRHIGRSRGREARRSPQALSARSHPHEDERAQTQRPAGPRQTRARRRWAQAPSPGRKPRRRHAKSQNGCPKDARSAPPVRREPAAAGAGEGGAGAARQPEPLRWVPPPPLGAPSPGAGPTPRPMPGPQPAAEPGEVPAVRPAPPPSAPAPSRTEPTRAGCSAVSPGSCTAAAGTARGLPGAPPPRRPRDPLRPALRSLPAEGSGCPRVPAAAGEGPPSPGRRRLRPARPLCVGGPGRGAEPDADSCGEARDGGPAPTAGRGPAGRGPGRGGSPPGACRGSEQGAAGRRHYSPSSICPSHSLTLGRGGAAAGGRGRGDVGPPLARGTLGSERRAGRRQPDNQIESGLALRRRSRHGPLLGGGESLGPAPTRAPGPSSAGPGAAALTSGSSWAVGFPVVYFTQTRSGAAWALAEGLAFGAGLERGLVLLWNS